MMIRVIIIFLIVVMILAVFGKLGWLGRVLPKRKTPFWTRKSICRRCKTPLVGRGSCPCEVNTRK